MSLIEQIITPTMTRREARSALVKAGWSWVGGGSFAAVYGSPDGKRVAKVTKPDEGAEATYRVSVANADNPYLPTYYGRIPLANGGAVYEVERLIPFADDEDYAEAEERARRHSTKFRFAEQALLDTTYGDFALTNDSHWRNAMMRPNGRIVLTDLLADIDQLANASVSAGQAEDGDFTDCYRCGSNHWTDAPFFDAEAA